MITLSPHSFFGGMMTEEEEEELNS